MKIHFTVQCKQINLFTKVDVLRILCIRGATQSSFLSSQCTIQCFVLAFGGFCLCS